MSQMRYLKKKKDSLIPIFGTLIECIKFDDIISNAYIDLRERNNFKRKNEYNIKKQIKSHNFNFINNIIQLIYIIVIIEYTILKNIYVTPKTNKKMINYYYSVIKIKINEIGYANIYNPSFTPPSKIIINGEEIFPVTYEYQFDKLNNTIELIWNNKLSSISRMFSGCSDISEIDLSGIDMTEVTCMCNMFYGCTKLKYINMTKLDPIINTCNYAGIFDYVPDDVVLCSVNMNYKLKNLLQGKRCLNIDCSNQWRSKIAKVRINGICYDGCAFEKCLLCPEPAFSRSICSICNTGYFPKENDDSNFESYFDCYKEPEGYYLSNNLYKKCYYSCERCEEKGDKINHKCIKCFANYTFEINVDNLINCYENCSYYYYIDNNYDYHCTLNYSCPNEYNKLIPYKRKCIDNCKNDDLYRYELKNICYNNCPFPYSKLINDTYCQCEEEKMLEIIIQECRKNCSVNNLIKKLCIFEYLIIEPNFESIENEYTRYMDMILKYLEKCLTSPEYNISNSINKNEDILIIDKLIITLTTSENQKNNINKNMTTIDLGDCEKKLREYYQIPPNEKLFIKKYDVIQEGMKISKIEYDLYSRINGSKLEKLNKTLCKHDVSFYIPIIINEDIDKLNSSSGYYNDICYSTTSESGTDIILKDRKEDFIKNNKTVCQDDCIFSEYNNYSISKAKCSCKIKETPSSFKDMKINLTKLYKDFVDIKNIANFNILKCYKLLFTKHGIIINIGFFIVMVIIIFHIICIFIFYIKKLKKILNQIKDIILSANIFRLSKYNKNRLEKNGNNKNNKKYNDKLKKRKKGKIMDDSNNIKLKGDKNINEYLKKKKKKRNEKKDKIKSPTKKIKINHKNENKEKDKDKANLIQNILEWNKNNKHNLETKGPNIIKMINSKYKKQITIKKIKNIMKYNDDEINSLPYHLAIQYDKRTYCKYYLSLLKTKHNLIFTFCNNNDYNAKIIKIDLFLVDFVIQYCLNAMFFDDDTMHQIYISNGSFGLEYQILKIIYSSLISLILNALLTLLALSNENIIEFKQKKLNNNIKKNEKALKKILSIKFILYFIISFILLLFFWFYLSVFGLIYRNTQYHLLEDTLISFGLSLSYSMFKYLIFKIQ